MSNQLVFTHQSALEILRYYSMGCGRLDASMITRFPKSIGGLSCYAQASERIERVSPLLELSEPVQFSVRSASCTMRDAHTIVHVCNSVLPRKALLRIDEQLLVASAPLALSQIAFRLDCVGVALKALELCGTYRVMPDGRVEYKVKPLTSASDLRSYLEANESLPGARRALEALAYVRDGSASPRESQLLLLLCMPMCKGGAGIPFPEMNLGFVCDDWARAISGRNALFCDLCWPDVKLDVEYQSEECHAGEFNRIRDSRRTNALKAMGFEVIEVTNKELDTMSDMDVIARTIKHKLGMQDRVRTKDYFKKQVALRKRLRLRVDLG